MPMRVDRDDEELVLASGVNAATGGYMFAPLSLTTACSLAAGMPLDATEAAALKAVYRPDEERYLGVAYGVDPNDLSRAGWGVVFAKDAAPELRDALHPLLTHRASQAGDLYREISGTAGYRAGESVPDFLARFGSSYGPVSPSVLPYHLLLVGDPRAIPFEFQWQLDVVHAVGRISFDTADQYAAYARRVVDAECHPVARARTVGFFATRHPGDTATKRSANMLVGALATRLRDCHPGWNVEEHVGEQATKAQLTRMLVGAAAPPFVFTATHGVGFPCGHEHQRAHQGALLCQEWPGPLAPQRGIPSDQYFSADDLGENAALAGGISFLFACYGAGTPERDEFAPDELPEAARIAPAPFVARLPERMLERGALAVVGHVDRAWGCSFSWPRAGAQIEVFRSTIECLMDGRPIGSAMQFINERYAAIATELEMEVPQRRLGKRNDVTVAGLWTAKNDARNYVILGDPAVRLTFS